MCFRTISQCHIPLACSKDLHEFFQILGEFKMHFFKTAQYPGIHFGEVLLERLACVESPLWRSRFFTCMWLHGPRPGCMRGASVVSSSNSTALKSQHKFYSFNCFLPCTSGSVLFSSHLILFVSMLFGSYEVILTWIMVRFSFSTQFEV